ncbi:MAG: (Fe-S)-binding protein [Nitrososphaeria archaeon]
MDPHTYDLLAAVYPKYVEGFGADVEVLHYTDLLGGLELKNLGISVAYHEPCHFAVRDEPFTSMGYLLGRVASEEIMGQHRLRGLRALAYWLSSTFIALSGALAVAMTVNYPALAAGLPASWPRPAR